MRRRTKIILIALLATVVVVGSIGGVALAADGGDEGNNLPGAQRGALLDRACEIYQEKTGVAIDQEALKEAFAQAQGEGREAALESRLQHMVEEGKITQDEADQYREWLEAKPEVPVKFGFGGRGGHFAPRFGGMPCAPAE